MFPHDGAGGGGPTPRKLRVASSRIAYPRMNVAWTMSSGVALGRICQPMTRARGAPSAFAASTYGISRMRSALPRTTRATRGV